MTHESFGDGFSLASGSPFGSRLASLNHHAASSLLFGSSNLSRAVLVLPLTELNHTFIHGIIIITN